MTAHCAHFFFYENERALAFIFPYVYFIFFHEPTKLASSSGILSNCLVVKAVLVLKDTFSDITYMCAPAYLVSSFQHNLNDRGTNFTSTFHALACY